MQRHALGRITSRNIALAVNRYRFQCREWSAATGLVNFRARWYDAVTGRWLSKEPIGLSGGLNLYAFCGNDPGNNFDPFGFDIWIGKSQIGILPHRSINIGNPNGHFDPYSFAPDDRMSNSGWKIFNPWNNVGTVYRDHRQSSVD